MIKTVEQLKEQAIKIGLTQWVVHNCSICYYPCSYLFSNNWEKVEFDSGCDCVGTCHIEPRSWDNVAYNYNLNQPENNPEISKEFLDELNKTWKF